MSLYMIYLIANMNMSHLYYKQ